MTENYKLERALLILHEASAGRFRLHEGYVAKLAMSQPTAMKISTALREAGLLTRSRKNRSHPFVYRLTPKGRYMLADHIAKSHQGGMTNP